MSPMTSLPLDPALPHGFYSTSNEERSEAELAQWWERPFACTNLDGTLDVRCLDGGAWDRPTFYGRAGSMEEAYVRVHHKFRFTHRKRSHHGICRNMVEKHVIAGAAPNEGGFRSIANRAGSACGRLDHRVGA